MVDEPRWIATPHLGADFGAPPDRPRTLFIDPAHAPPMIEQLRSIVERQGARAAVEYDGQATSYSRLWQGIEALATQIEQGDPEKANVGILLSPGPAYVAAIFACLLARRPCVPLDHGVPAARNAQIAAQTNLAQIVCQLGDTRLDDVEFGVRLLRIGALPLGPSRRVTPPLPLDDPAFILCTSGSTGQPKALVHSQRTLLHWVRTTNTALQTRPDDRALTLSPPSSLAGTLGVLNFVLSGACVQMFDLKSAGLDGLLRTISGRGVTILRAAPSMLRTLVRLPGVRAALSGLRAVQTYGEPLMKADLAEWRGCLPSDCLVLSTYGSTEATGMGGFLRADDDHDPIRASAGVLMPDTVAALVDETGRSSEEGEAGELWIRSRYNALGEWHDGQRVDGRLVPHASGDGTRVYKTGDLARCHADGVFVVLGRLDRMAKVNGQRVEPAEIEVILRAHADVHDVEVMTVAAAGQVGQLVAFVVARDGAAADWPSRLRHMLRASLPAYMVPSRIVAVDSMPRLPGGKVDAPALARLVSEQPPASP